MQRHGWTLLFHEGCIAQLEKLEKAANRAISRDPEGAQHNANVKLFRAVSRLILDTIPSDPSRADYLQGNTLGATHRHWRRARIGRRFRLFFRYDSRSKIIIYAWLNDTKSLRPAGSRSDPYQRFRQLLLSGNPPDDWAALLAACRTGHDI